MRYVMFMIPAVYATDAVDELPSPDMIDTMMRYNAELAEAGVLESLNGLHPPSHGLRVAFGPGAPRVESVEADGAIGGYWILDVDSHEAAVAWAKRCPALPGDVLELRRIQEIEEFPADVQDVVAGYDL
jgi:hypothetical protein